MGKRGPAKTPSSVLKTRGTFRADRHSDAVDKHLDAEVPPPPPHFDTAAKKKWHEIGKLLASRGLLTQLDAIALEMLVSSYLGLVETAKQLGKQDLVYFIGENGSPVPNPLVSINAKHAALLKWCLVQFGCTPSARCSVRPTPTEQPADPMEALIAGR